MAEDREEIFAELTYVESSFDPCLFFLPLNACEKKEQGNIGFAGLVLLDVDDFAQGGNLRRQSKMQELREKLRVYKVLQGISEGW